MKTEIEIQFRDQRSNYPSPYSCPDCGSVTEPIRTWASIAYQGGLKARAHNVPSYRCFGCSDSQHFTPEVLIDLSFQLFRYLVASGESSAARDSFRYAQLLDTEIRTP